MSLIPGCSLISGGSALTRARGQQASHRDEGGSESEGGAEPLRMSVRTRGGGGGGWWRKDSRDQAASDHGLASAPPSSSLSRVTKASVAVPVPPLLPSHMPNALPPALLLTWSEAIGLALTGRCERSRWPAARQGRGGARKRGDGTRGVREDGSVQAEDGNRERGEAALRDATKLLMQGRLATLAMSASPPDASRVASHDSMRIGHARDDRS
eukprot:2387865-Rhodomonas_salina.1